MNIIDDYLSNLTQCHSDDMCEIAKRDTNTGSIGILLDHPVLRIDADKMWISHNISVELRDLDGTCLKEPYTVGSVEQYGSQSWTLTWDRYIPALLMREPAITAKTVEGIGIAVLNRLPECIATLRILHQEWSTLDSMFLADRVREDKI
ncbi:MAG: hypothetical protein WC907_07805 [Acholeplasmataceae bacterium]|jgi:hypothetical protein